MVCCVSVNIPLRILFDLKSYLNQIVTNAENVFLGKCLGADAQREASLVNHL
jgi:hypothetical protein